MAKKKTDKVDMLLSMLDKQKLFDFIKRECREDGQFKARFLALGAGTVFKPKASTYTDRVIDIINDLSDEFGFVDWGGASDVNEKVSRILEEADEAMRDQRWEVALAVLTGVSDACGDIIECGDDSNGELGDTVDECFRRLHDLSHKELPEKIRGELFCSALANFESGHLHGWDWWWDWIEIAIDTAEDDGDLDEVKEALHSLTLGESNEWRAKHNAETAKKYLLKIMAKSGGEADQVRYMYENVSNPDFRRKLLQRAWDAGDFSEALRLAREGEVNDAQYLGLVSEWLEWQLKIYRHQGDVENALRLARHFFFRGGRRGDKEFAMDSMYGLMRSLVPSGQWKEYVEGLIAETQERYLVFQRLYIYTEEKMWDRYMEHLRRNPSTNALEGAPKELLKLYKDEFITLYAQCVRSFFLRANGRDAYRQGAGLLKTLKKFGGKKDADIIIQEQKSRRPRRPALIEELSKI